MAVSDARTGVTLQGQRALSSDEGRAWEAESGRASAQFLTARGLSPHFPPRLHISSLCRRHAPPPTPFALTTPSLTLPTHTPTHTLPASRPPHQTKGIDIGQVQVMFHVNTCVGLVRHPDGSLQKKFSEKEELFPMQARGPVMQLYFESHRASVLARLRASALRASAPVPASLAVGWASAADWELGGHVCLTACAVCVCVLCR